ncbi:DUF4003 family protein [uncultured Clostridium sp.]|uniref:DUF4003 family protein n=1 Tax=uncultured Clostridium sp. TaxID=59620 RepID=UPI0025F46ADB|nr:DUF4003 family protein [uncultured Clostridium sp.]
MEKIIKEICDTTVKNYRYAVRNLRYDGDYINHFSALLNGYHGKSIPYDEVKKIRVYIKNNTSKMSVFRGDILYILSFLISQSDTDNEKMSDEILEVFEMFTKERFSECEHLVLAAFSVVRYVEKDNRELIIKRTRHIFNIMKQKYGNLTKEDDYLLCTLLAIKGLKFDCMTEYMEFIFNYMHDLKLFSDNGVQCLTNSILLNSNENTPGKVSELIFALGKNDLKIGHQFLQLLGIMVEDQDIEKSVDKMREIIEYLCEEESEYNFYIDKDFRNMIAFVIAFNDYDNINKKYIDELLAFGTYSFLVSKNQGILNEVLA